MFSQKEFFALAVGLALSLLYFICRFCILMNDATAEMIGGLLIILQIIPFFLYSALTNMHLKMLYLSRKFMDKSVEGDFKKTFRLLKYSEMITALSVFWILLMAVDIPTFINLWAKYPADAAKLMLMPVWLVSDLWDRWNYAIMWFLPFTVLSAVLELFTYKQYFKAKHRFTHLYPSVDAPDFYNAFISKRKKERHTMIVPRDSLEEIEVPPCEAVSHREENKTDPYSPLGKNLGNNSLYVVDAELLNKRRNTLKTQAEIDAEEGGFFSGEEGTDNMISFFPKRKANIDKKSQEYSRLQILNEMGNVQPEDIRAAKEKKAEKKEMPLDSEIPLDFDYQSFYRAKDPKEKEKEKEKEKKEEVTLITCPFCGTVNPEDREECIFCGASLEKEKNIELIPCPFCGTINPDDRGECIFCGAELTSKGW